MCTTDLSVFGSSERWELENRCEREGDRGESEDEVEHGWEAP